MNRQPNVNRRSFLRGLIAAPAVVAASSLMPISSIDYILAGYRRKNPLEIGAFYCPYIPLQYYRIDKREFEDVHKTEFVTRYGVVSSDSLCIDDHAYQSNRDFVDTRYAEGLAINSRLAS